MRVYLKNKSVSYSAVGEYDYESNALTLQVGSKVSDSIAYSEKFRGAKTVERLREQYVINGTVKEDVLFKSPSTAANFVTGRSTNGLITWKDENGRSLKEIFTPNAD